MKTTVKNNSTKVVNTTKKETTKKVNQRLDNIIVSNVNLLKETKTKKEKPVKKMGSSPFYLSSLSSLLSYL